MTDLFLKIKMHLQQNLPFVVFCKPNSEDIIGLFQKNDHVYSLKNFEEKGFVFVPFDANDYPYIPLEFSDLYVEKHKPNTFHYPTNYEYVNDEDVKNKFVKLVAKGINSINEHRFSKVVLSRKESIEIKEFDAFTAFLKLIAQYPTAFKYYFNHPKIGSWLGATPEQFLQTDGNKLKTVALAGTQLNVENKEVIWQQKERVEQQLVTDFIVQSITPFVKEITISTPYSIKAGNLWHIKTDIEAVSKNKNMFQNVIQALHPTSAVCGLPKL
jgi:isochorismate synthase